MRRSTFNGNGERKTIAVCNCHDLGPFPDLCRTDARPPFLALAKEPSMNASVRSRPPRFRRSSASVISNRSRCPSSTHSWNLRWQVWYGGYREGMSFHGAPVRRTHRMPFKTSRLLRLGRPLPSVRLGGSGRRGSRMVHCASVRSIQRVDHSSVRLSIPARKVIEI